MTVLEARRAAHEPFPLYPPAAWFDKPSWLEPLQKLTVVTNGPDAGRVAGYVAPWDQCLLDGTSECWTIPTSPTGYSQAMQGDTETAEGSIVRTANLGGGVNHARLAANFREAVKHYHNAQPLWAKVLTPNGWTTMGALRMGDRVIDPDGAASTVEGIYPRGVQQVWSVELGDGSRTYATGDHLWRVTVSGGSGNQERVVTTEYLADRLARSSAAPLYVTPVRPHDGVGYLPIDPYALGALIGDGGMTGRGLKFTTADDDLAAEVERRLPDGVVVKHVPTANRPNEYRIVDMGVHSNRNRICDALRAVGLMGAHSYEKFLPTAAFDLSAVDRLDLLRGLMDTDGHASTEGQAVFVTTSRRLADDVVALVRSLGGRSRVKKQKQGTWTSPAQKAPKTARPSYWLNVALPYGQCPFELHRKAERYKHRSSFRGNRITKVSRTGIVAQVQCIRVSAPSHCYVTDDYMPTHNTAAQVARVQYHEDEHGVYLAGAMWPDVTEQQVAIVRAAAVSGDWRYLPHVGGYDLCGVQLVNTPGFPLIRRVARTAGFEPVTAITDDHERHPVFIGGLGGVGEIDDIQEEHCCSMCEARDARIAACRDAVQELAEVGCLEQIEDALAHIALT